MDRVRTLIFVSLFLVIYPPVFCAPSNPLGLVINELNIKVSVAQYLCLKNKATQISPQDAQNIGEKEFFELRGFTTTTRVSLQHYYVVGIKSLTIDSSLEGSSIELYVNLWNHQLNPDR